MKKFYTLFLFALMAMAVSAQEVQGPYLDPIGEEVLNKVECDGYASFFSILPDRSLGASKVIYGENNEVYFKIVPRAGHTGYVKCIKNGNKITVDLPQHVGTIIDEFYGEEWEVYADVLHVVYPEGYADYVNTGEPSTVEFTVADDGSFSIDMKTWEEGADPEQFIGLVTDLDPESYSFIGIADWGERYSVSTDTPTLLPEGLEAETWVALYDGEARNVKVAISGNNIYLGNLTDEFADSYVKGTIEGDKVTFPLTYLGFQESTNRFMYFVPGYWEEKYIEAWDDYYTDYVIHDTFVFDYDAEGKQLNNIEEAAAFFVGTSNVVGDFGGSWIEMFYEPQIVWVDPSKADDPLQDPEFVFAYPDERGWDTVQFFLPSTNVSDYPLDTNKLSYIFYVDGEPFTFTPDVYLGIYEDMTELPFNFSDDYFDILSYGQAHELNLFIHGYKTVGLKMFYEKPDGTVIESNYVEADIEELSDGEITGISDISAEAESVTYYDLQGRLVSKPAGGVNIQVTRLTDGTRKVEKMLMK